MILKLNSNISTAAWVDMKGIQVGMSEELDKLYFLRNRKHAFKKRQTSFKDFYNVSFKNKKRQRPFVMTFNWNYSLLHSNNTIWRSLRRVYEEVCVDQRVLSYLWRVDVFKTRSYNESYLKLNIFKKLPSVWCRTPQVQH